MLRRYALPVSLLTFLLILQAQLWLGRGSVFHVRELRSQLQAQQSSNHALRLANARLTAELNDLQEGLEMVEEWARKVQDLIKPGEILVKIAK